MAYLDPAILLQQAGILGPKPAAPAPVGPDYGPPPSANPNYAPPSDPLSTLLQSKARQGAAIAQPEAPAAPFPSLESIARGYLGLYGKPVAELTDAVGLTKEDQVARTGAAQAIGAGGISPGDIMTTDGRGDGAPAPAPARQMGGGGGGGAPRPAEIDLLTPTQRREYEKGMAMERDAATQGAERTRQALQLQEAAAHDYERNLQAEEAGRMRAEQTRADELRFRQQDYDDAVKQASQFKIDPMRSSKGGAWFGDMLGILLTGIAGKPELALNEIDKRINRDVDAQRAEYQALRDKASGAQNAYGMAMQRMGDARAAEKVTRDALAQQYATAMQRAAIGMKSAEAESLAQKTMADLQMKYADDTLRFLKATPTGGGSPTLKLPDLDEKSLVTGPDGKQYYVPEGEKTRAKMGAIADINANIDEAIKIRDSMGVMDWVNPLSAKQMRLKGLQADTERKATVYSGQGAMSAGDRQVATEALGAMTGVLGGNTDVLKNTRAQMAAEGQRALVSQNAMPVQVVTMINQKTGIPERKVIPSGQTYSGPAARPGMPGSTTPIGAGGKK